MLATLFGKGPKTAFTYRARISFSTKNIASVLQGKEIGSIS